MSDLISRAETIKAIRKCKFESDMPSYWYIGMEDAQNIVKTLPSADTVEVVRCKDCKHHEDFFVGAEGSLLCWKGGTDRVVSAMGYCKYGERSEE